LGLGVPITWGYVPFYGAEFTPPKRGMRIGGPLASKRTRSDLVVTIVVLDSNIWTKEVLLRSPLGQALLQALLQLDGRIAVPWVVAQEVPGVMAQRVTEALTKAKKESGIVAGVLGGNPVEFPDPSVDSIKREVEERMRELRPTVEFLEKHSTEQGDSALQRVFDHRPPSESKEQYRDSLLWECILQLANSSSVVFITNDTDFYADRKQLDKGLAKELREEASGRVEVYPHIGKYLETVGDLRIVLPEYAEGMIQAEFIRMLQPHLDRWRFTPGPANQSLLKTYKTARTGFLSVDFEFYYGDTEVLAADGSVLPSATLTITGSCSVNTRERKIEDLRLDHAECVGPEGEIVGRNVYLNVESVVGQGHASVLVSTSGRGHITYED
jgi:hypothetical protein